MDIGQILNIQQEENELMRRRQNNSRKVIRTLERSADMTVGEFTGPKKKGVDQEILFNFLSHIVCV